MAGPSLSQESCGDPWTVPDRGQSRAAGMGLEGVGCWLENAVTDLKVPERMVWEGR